MRSRELARLAGVTTRTLRHYHSIGLLPEPPRSSNGYREYDTADLARLIRIKRLSSLGFSLSKIADFMQQSVEEESEKSLEKAFCELETELDQQIERLQEQKRIIEILREEQLDPALPMRFARIVKTLMDIGVYDGDPKVLSEDILITLSAYFSSEADLAELEQIIGAVDERGLAKRWRLLDDRYDKLPADADQASRDAIVEEAISLFSQVADSFDAQNWKKDVTVGEQLIIESERAAYNEAQFEVSERIGKELEKIVLDLDATS